MKCIPVTLKEANKFVTSFHRHLKATRGGRFAIGADQNGLVGVAIVGRPIARMLDDGTTAEVTRCCVLENGPKNICSFLYGRCWRIWQQMGGLKMVTYTLSTDSGSSLKGAGWNPAQITEGNKWTRKNRSREWQPIYGQRKLRWEIHNEK